MAKYYTFQAVDSVDGAVRTWRTQDAGATEYPGPGLAQQVCLLSQHGVLTPYQTAFIVAGTYTWSVPRNMVYAEAVVVGGGQAGADGGNGVGGAGGSSGQIIPGAVLPGKRASLHTSGGMAWPTNWPLADYTELTIVVGAGGASNGASGGSSSISLPFNSNRTILHAAGGGPGPGGAVGDVRSLADLSAWQATRPTGGAGGTASNGSRGYHSGYGSGGNGGSGAGLNGTGFGAGGGGGRNASGTSAGGGGGAGGYGWSFPADGFGGGSGSAGWTGVVGAVILTAWVD